MTFDLVAGIALTVLALGVVIFLTLWGRRIIERSHSKSRKRLRKTRREVDNE